MENKEKQSLVGLAPIITTVIKNVAGMTNKFTRPHKINYNPLWNNEEKRLNIDNIVSTVVVG